MPPKKKRPCCKPQNKSSVSIGGSLSMFFQDDKKTKRKLSKKRPTVKASFKERDIFTDELGREHYVLKDDEMTKEILKRRAKRDKQPPPLPTIPSAPTSNLFATKLSSQKKKLKTNTSSSSQSSSSQSSSSQSSSSQPSTKGVNTANSFTSYWASVPQSFKSTLVGTKWKRDTMEYLFDLTKRGTITPNELKKTPKGAPIRRYELNLLGLHYGIPDYAVNTGKSGIDNATLRDLIANASS